MLRWIHRYKLRRLRRKYQHLESLDQVWLLAKEYSQWIKPHWMIQAFPPGRIVTHPITSVFNNARHFHDAVIRCEKVVANRGYIPPADKLDTATSQVFDDWVVDEKGYEVNVAELVNRTFPVIAAIISNVEACQLSRQDFYDYYRRLLRFYLETYIALVEVGMELYLTGVK